MVFFGSLNDAKFTQADSVLGSVSFGARYGVIVAADLARLGALITITRIADSQSLHRFASVAMMKIEATIGCKNNADQELQKSGRFASKLRRKEIEKVLFRIFTMGTAHG